MTEPMSRLRALLSPQKGFSSGIRIYEPQDADPLAPVKRKIIALAVSISSEGAESGVRASVHKGWAKALRESQKDTQEIHDAERAEYLELIRAIEDVVSSRADIAQEK